MAFNFNWSPLTADSGFYERAKELLTTALNKSPKPPIIVDDILVNELNLGSVPPELEILEIGDLAEDRFRGIFKMCYSGDAFVTLKTRVQANPLNTYLSTRPSFTSPQPLAAASGLTIPLQITLSDFKLSAFIILVFSKQKGLTLVFRNDPLESMVVSSTFDSIPFVRDYLQKEIEGQLRILLQDEVPAIIHRLSLRLWVPDQLQQMNTQPEAAKLMDPLSTPPQDGILGDQEPSFLNLDSSSSEDPAFSQKNLSRLSALDDSNHTLALFDIPIREAVFRAWASASERSSGHGVNTPHAVFSPSLKQNASGSNATLYSFSDAGSSSTSVASRPALHSFASSATGLSLGAGRHTRSHLKKKKKRVINLRQSRSVEPSIADSDSADGRSETSEPPISWHSNPLEILSPMIPPSIQEEEESPPRPKLGQKEPENKVQTKDKEVARSPAQPDVQALAESAGSRGQNSPSSVHSRPLSSYFAEKHHHYGFGGLSTSSSLHNFASITSPPSFTSLDQAVAGSSRNHHHHGHPSSPPIISPSSILEQAFLYKLASEIARQNMARDGRLANEKRTPFGEPEYEDAPPAYAVQ